MKNTNFVYKYWNRTEYGRKMIASDRVSESDLLFLIPNNVKKAHGLPLTRMIGKKKRKNKKQRRKFIFSFSLFDLLEEIIEETLCCEWTQNDFFGKFVDVRDLSLGNGDYYEPRIVESERSYFQAHRAILQTK